MVSALHALYVGQLAKIISSQFCDGGLDVVGRGKTPGGTWNRMPEVQCVEHLRALEVPRHTVRLFITFMAAMDRARDATRLWNNGIKLFEHHPELFQPSEVSAIPVPRLRTLLSHFAVSQRHEIDSSTWSSIAQSLDDKRNPISHVVRFGVGDAKELLWYLRTTSGGRPRFPLLKGPKIGPMWVRMLVAPGAAEIDNLEIIPVAVDTHVRRVTENLGVTATRGRSLEEARPVIQDAWRAAVETISIGGPPGMANTCAALDPALWSFGRYGCGHCERLGRLSPINRACDQCQLRISAQS